MSQENADLVYVPHRIARKKGYFFARYGRNSRKAADKLCATMRRQGCPCRVVQN